MDAIAPESEIDQADFCGRRLLREGAEITMNAPSLPFHAVLCVGADRYDRRVEVDAQYLAGRHVVLLPRFALVTEYDDADAIGLEYGRADEFREDLVIGTIGQLRRLRSLFQSYCAEEAEDPDAVDLWDSFIRPLDAVIEPASSVISRSLVPVGGWLS
jgi:hypothetical protein